MTESEWLACEDPSGVLRQRGQVSERKLILFGCACCRRHWHLFPDESCRAAVVAAERYADGHSGSDDLRQVRRRIEADYPNLHWPECCGSHAVSAAYYAAFDDSAAREFEVEHPLGGDFDDMLAALKDEVAVLVAVAAIGRHGLEEDFARERAVQTVLLKDLIGDPFRPATVNTGWLSSNVMALARTIYEERAFDRMPELADALEEAGCQDAALLGHCRHHGPHARGCWVVDALLGKS